MQHKFLMASFLSLFLFMQPFAVSAVDLQHEATVQRLVTALEMENYYRAYEILQGLRQDGTEIKGELVYYESLAALSTKRDFEAFDQAQKYIEQNGKDAKHYSNALEIYTAAGENIDRKLAINSIENWNAASFELYTEMRKTSLWNDFYDNKVYRHKYISSQYVDNKDGTISIYRIVKAGSNSADLYKFEMYACPLGVTYKNGACYGTPDKYENLNEVNINKITKSLSLAGHSDWRIPRKLFILNDDQSSYRPDDFFRISPAITEFDGQRYAKTDYGVTTNDIHPQAYLFNDHGFDELNQYKKSTGSHFKKDTYQIPQFGFPYLKDIDFFLNGDNSYCALISATPYCDDDVGQYMVLPVRGPELVDENLQVTQCDPEREWLDCINIDGSIKMFGFYTDVREIEYLKNLSDK